MLLCQHINKNIMWVTRRSFTGQYNLLFSGDWLVFTLKFSWHSVSCGGESVRPAGFNLIWNIDPASSIYTLTYTSRIKARCTLSVYMKDIQLNQQQHIGNSRTSTSCLSAFKNMSCQQSFLVLICIISTAYIKSAFLAGKKTCKHQSSIRSPQTSADVSNFIVAFLE